MTLIHVDSDEDFKTKVVEETEKIVVVDFWAPWCMPCKGYSPVFEKVGEEGMDGVIFAKANIDELEETSDTLGIRSVPTTMIVKVGKVLDAKPGALTEELLKEFVEKHK